MAGIRIKEEIKQKILEMVDLGHPASDLAKKYNVHKVTINRWTKEKRAMKVPEEAILRQLQRQLFSLTKQKSPSSAAIQKIAALSKAIDRQQKAMLRNAPLHTPKTKGKAKPKIESSDQVAALREKILSDEYGMYSYQRDFIRSESQFRMVLKARQIGFSYSAGADALLSALDGHNQLFLSASEEQAILLMKYTSYHAEKLGIALDGGITEWRLPNGAVIKALAHNFRTVQGFTGDIWMDEFAWYPNPKRIWGAFVPSIGAIQGRLTVMSTPFEKDGLFHDLFFNTERYYMFDRFRVDIYDAMAGGLKFDLETMKALFDADTWFTMYECGFTDDESALFSIDLIKSCVDTSAAYRTPNPDSLLYAGYDIGRTRDASALAAMIQTNSSTMPKGMPSEYALTQIDVLRKASFDEQELHLNSFLDMYPHACLRMDKTGIGMNLTETMISRYRSRVQGIHFTAQMKESMCLNLKKLFEDRRITIPNDPALITEIHSIKRKAGQKSFLYDADRNSSGHADRFWALALAASHVEGIIEKRKGRAWII